MKDLILEIDGLSISFMRYGRGIHQKRIPAVRTLDLRIHSGEIVAVVGASGSGKSLLAHAILGLLPENARQGGRILFRGEILTPYRAADLRGQQITLIPQSLNCLDPMMKIGEQLGCRGTAGKEAMQEILEKYNLSEEIKGMYPFELSGGMLRRVLIAAAMLCKPALVVADEPTAGLDTQTLGPILNHFRMMADEGTAVLLITHDLNAALTIADRITVCCHGETLEDVSAAAFAEGRRLFHPYTRALWNAMPQHAFWGEQSPWTEKQPQGEMCPFRMICEHREADCRGAIPWVQTRDGCVRCLHPKEAEA